MQKGGGRGGGRKKDKDADSSVEKEKGEKQFNCEGTEAYNIIYFANYQY